jgi:hypothetical protein
MDVIRDRAIVELNQNNVKVLGTNLQATSDRFEIGDLTRTDVAQSEARLQLGRSLLAISDGRRTASEATYRQVVGHAPGVLAPPPPLPQSSVPNPPSGALSITYQGEVFQVTKDRFIIGRGKQTSDLTIKDPNVSRQHAMIEFLTGQYYIVDMGSTNGVEYNGQRVQRKVISDGDTFKVCDHELRFSFQ